MKTPAAALSWEFWAREQRTLVGWGSVGLAFIAFIYYTLGALGAKPDELAKSAIHIVCLLVFLPMVMAIGSSLSGRLTPRFALPVSTSALVLWPLLNGLVLCELSYLLFAAFANGLFDADWPVLQPLAFIATSYVICDAVSLLFAGEDKWRPLTSMITCGSLLIGLCVTRAKASDLDGLSWLRLTWGESVGLACVAAGLLIAAVISTRLARQGQALSIVKLFSAIVQLLDFRGRSPSPFASARAAHTWSEWMSKGVLVAVYPLYVAVPLSIWFGTGYASPDQVLGGLGVMTYMYVMLSPFVGAFLGHQGRQFDIAEFTATRPMTDTQLADATVLSAAKSYLLGWHIWWVGAAVALGCAMLSGSAPSTPEELFPLHNPPTTWGMAGLYLLALYGGLLLAGWTFGSLGVTLVLLRAWLCSTIVLCIVCTPIVLAVFLPQPVPHGVQVLLWLALIVVLVGATFGTYVTAFRLRLIGKTRSAVAVSLYVVFCAAAILVLPTPLHKHLLYHGVLCAICTLPFVAPAAAPLAVWWNRHR